MKNNKGFSLVELIIVIAIMAVLVGVLAPTYLQYVEKSKKSNDVSTVDSIVNAIEICAIDPEVQVAGDWELTVIVDTTGIAIIDNKSTNKDVAILTADNKAQLDSAMEKALYAIVGDATLKSSKWTGNQFVLQAKPDGEYGKVKMQMNTKVKGNKDFNGFAKTTKITFAEANLYDGAGKDGYTPAGKK